MCIRDRPEHVLHQQVIIFDRNHKCIKSTTIKVQAYESSKVRIKYLKIAKIEIRNSNVIEYI